jgi:hypothetical protein
MNPGWLIERRRYTRDDFQNDDDIPGMVSLGGQTYDRKTRLISVSRLIIYRQVPEIEAEDMSLCSASAVSRLSYYCPEVFPVSPEWQTTNQRLTHWYTMCTLARLDQNAHGIHR